jgi:hypothetical protein
MPVYLQPRTPRFLILQRIDLMFEHACSYLPCTLHRILSSKVKTHIFSATEELVGIAKHHRYLLSRMVPAMQMVVSARFRYSAALVPWTDAELDQIHKVWLQVHRSAWRSTPGDASAPLVLPETKGGCPVAHPRVLMIQALATHIEQLCALPDELWQTTIDRY